MAVIRQSQIKNLKSKILLRGRERRGAEFGSRNRKSKIANQKSRLNLGGAVNAEAGEEIPRGFRKSRAGQEVHPRRGAGEGQGDRLREVRRDGRVDDVAGR